MNISFMYLLILFFNDVHFTRVLLEPKLLSQFKYDKLWLVVYHFNMNLSLFLHYVKNQPYQGYEKKLWYKSYVNK